MKKQTKKSNKKKSNIKKAIKRPDVLNGASYKLKDVPNGMHGLASLFVTINSHKNKPFEMFIDVKDKLLYEHLTVYTRLISKMLQHGMDKKVIIQELKDITSDSTGHYIPKRGGVYVNSLAGRIGVCLEEH